MRFSSPLEKKLAYQIEDLKEELFELERTKQLWLEQDPLREKRYLEIPVEIEGLRDAYGNILWSRNASLQYTGRFLEKNAS